MTRGSWKESERAIAARIGEKRIPINGREGPDITHDHLALEVKSRSKVPAYLLEWLKQAEKGAEGKTPVVIIHEKNKRHENDVVVFRLGDWEKLIHDNA